MKTKPASSFEALRNEIDRLRQLIHKQQKAIEILVAAGFVSLEKVKQAEALADLP